MLKINNLHVSIDGKQIIKGLNLSINKGEVHALMGPNGSGKSTLSYVLSGKEGYEIDEGTIEYNGKNLLELDVDERANAGLFLAFQYPMEIPGVQTSFFLKTAINSKRKFLGMPEIDALEFAKLIKSHAEDLGIGSEMLKRDLNVNYSGGEKKKQEILQMSILKPEMAIQDETDSRLDIDALSIVSEGVNKLRSEQNSFLVITHYQRLLNYIKPDFVHIIADGKIVKSGDFSLALELEEKGYEDISKTA
jgi:Fe-S cluster assembly ATP-binding protein